MNEPKTVNLNELRGAVEIEPNYFVELPETDRFVVVAGANYPDGATAFEHPNVAAKRDRVFSTRAYWPDGRKKWFSHAGRDFHFVIPRREISLVFEKGYSFVPVVINGHKFCFNVSGGTRNGWTDCVREEAHVGIGFTQAKLKLLAEVATPPGDCQGTLDLGELSPSEATEFKALMAGHVCRQRLDQGGQLFLQEGWSFDGQRGPFFVESKPRRKRYYLATTGRNRVRLDYPALDWLRTADANGFKVEEPATENRIGRVEPYADPTLQVG